MAGDLGDLTFRTLDLDDPDQAELAGGFVQAVLRGFHDTRADEAFRDRWLDFWREVGARVRGAWAPATVGPSERPVATFVSWGGELNTGAERLPAHLVSDVGVSPTHRRLGLMRRLMVEDLDHAVGQGRPVALLTASEGSIYGRFGFGPATRVRTVAVDTSPGFAFRDEVVPAPGRLDLVDPREAGAVTDAVFARFHAVSRGSVDRPPFYRWWTHEGFDTAARAVDAKAHTCVHVGDHGEPQGYVTYRHEGDVEGRSTLRVLDLTAATPGSYLRLWRFLADVDLAERVAWRRAPLVDPLPWALTDPRRVRVEHEGDLLWVRVLDVAAALRARPWGADGSVVLAVDDPLGHAAGRWRVRVTDGRADVTRADDGPQDDDVALTADTLGSLYLGDVDTVTLAAVGRLRGTPEALGTWGAMVDAGPAPYATTGF